jgi:hypothetical protein
MLVSKLHPNEHEELPLAGEERRRKGRNRLVSAKKLANLENVRVEVGELGATLLLLAPQIVKPLLLLHDLLLEILQL